MWKTDEVSNQKRLSRRVLAMFFLVALGLAAGFIDAIVGGGGLITLPALMVVLGPGPNSIGTNKIVGAAAAAIALFVYLRNGNFTRGPSIVFAIWVSLGALLGSSVAPAIPVFWFRYFLLLACPILLWIIWQRDMWNARNEIGDVQRTPLLIALSGILCGFYDGIWGPGGGTFMFLSLYLFAKFPLLAAIAASKLSNTASACSALVRYSAGGFVHWPEGLVMAAGVSTGAYFGAMQATRRAAKIVRPMLTAVVALLLAKIFIFGG